MGNKLHKKRLYTINLNFEMLKIFKDHSDLSKRMKCLIENLI